MNAYLDQNAVGLALMTVVMWVGTGLVGLACLVQAFRMLFRWVDKHCPPRPRREFRQVERNARGRKAMAKDIRPRYAQVSALDWDTLEQRVGKR